MLAALAGFLTKKYAAWATIVVVVSATLFLGTRAVRVERDDDILAFLPRTNPDIALFYDVNERFGGLSVALVGVAPSGGEVLTPEFLGRLKHATRSLNEIKGVDYAFSLANVDDFTPDVEKGGIGVDYLIPAVVPKAPAELAALREKVMSRDQVVGQLISADGKAALIMCFLAHGADPKLAAGSVREAVEASFPDDTKYWGGMPFMQTYIFGVTQKDLARLTPWACAAILLISIWAFRDVVGTVIALFTTAAGIAAALGLMGTFGVKTNIVLGSMPVILFALGSAYPIHVLTRYYALVREIGRDKAIEHAIVYLGPTVIASGLTTVGGLLSFVAMDIQPIRTFGLFTGIGVLTTLVLSVTFVPAVIRVANLKARVTLDNHTGKGMVWFCTTVARHRVPAGVALAGLALVGALFVGRLDSRVDNASFYSAASPPAQAERFLSERFGGSQYFQVHVEGDMTDPDVLRGVRDLADRICIIPHVSSVNHIGMVIAKMNEAMDGEERLPDTTAKVKLLYGFLAGKRAVSQLVTDDRAHALLHVKIDTDRAADMERVLAAVEETIAAEMPKRYVVADVHGPRGGEATKRLEGVVSARIHASLKQFGVKADHDQSARIAEHLGERHGVRVADTKPVEAAILSYLNSEEFIGDLPRSPEDAPRRIAAALSTLFGRPARPAIAAVIAGAVALPADDKVVVDLAATVERPLVEILRRQLALSEARRLAAGAHLAVPEGSQGQRLVTALAAALMDLELSSVALPSAPGEPGVALGVSVTGQPVLNRGLSQSVDRNQLKSFFMAMGLVLIICLTLYRSLWSALLAMAPVTVTLLVVYGGMGLLGVHLDIGTSMLASLTTGAGVDYAVHLLAAWKGPPGKEPADREALHGAASYAAFLVGRAIWTNALMVAGGFVVLTMGEAKPLQNVGALTAGAMMAAAVVTFAAIPAFARKRDYDRRPRIAELLPSADAVEPPLHEVSSPIPGGS